MAKKLRVKQIRSYISAKPKQKATLRALGLRKINAERVHDDTPVIRGMLQVVKHMVEVSEINE
ncbi:MAG TPA: 50S ribosomal protein L30 [Spirochaetota bacterium]|nr:50S ribosomal protein L30 [Spirochaetota bacterium]HOM09061.1 50S ribosomal protein L30 [Spirochaetota bacterium]HPP48809.1 50S ribosomal protein L30 [Spirochaetota bacterium]HXK65047.1 50S ribosomal protein L30 [Spirochaetota bacterium]